MSGGDWYGWTERILSVHEAAHAVAARRAGVEVSRVELIRGWWSGRVQRGWTHVEDFTDGTAEELLGYLTIFLVARPAEERFIAEHQLGSSFAFQDRTCAGDELDFDVESRGSVWSPGFVSDRAEALVDREWALILELGAELLAKGRLSGRALR